MTLVLAGTVTNTAVVAADRRISFGPLSGPFSQGEGDKLIEVGECVVASWGSSPPNVDVPALLREFSAMPRTPRDLADALNARVSALPDSGAFGLLIVGTAAGQIELWEVRLPNAISRITP